DVGGLARTIEKNGFRFDTGPHRWYTKNDMVNTWMLKLLGDEVVKVPRLTRIYFDQKFFNYPIKIKSTLMGMGLVKTSMAVLDYCFIRFIQLFYRKQPISLEDGYVAKFGRTLYQLFFKRYSEKLWGTSCQNISADWIGQRTRGFNIGTIIKETLFKSKEIVSFVDEFSYPKNGIGRIAQKMAEEIIKNGGTIILKSTVTKIQHINEHVTGITYVSKKISVTLEAEQVISSIPLSDLIDILSPVIPAEIAKVNKRLTYRDELQVAIFVKKTHVTPDTWVYVHSLELPFIRFMEMDNWSEKLSPDGTTTLVFEIACNVGDETWNLGDKELIERVIKAFISEFKLITRKDILGGHIHRMPKEYPVYHIGYREDVGKLKNYLARFRNLQLVGRNGTFRYNNMDHSIEMGLYSAWNIIENERKFDIESVNIEREYLEEKRLRVAEPELSEDQYVEEKH
ncbi:MAG: FAD-dependent oxidoreductase, partial [Patescibacteria group bacterium]